MYELFDVRCRVVTFNEVEVQSLYIFGVGLFFASCHRSDYLSLYEQHQQKYTKICHYLYNFKHCLTENPDSRVQWKKYFQRKSEFSSGQIRQKVKSPVISILDFTLDSVQAKTGMKTLLCKILNWNLDLHFEFKEVVHVQITKIHVRLMQLLVF